MKKLFVILALVLLAATGRSALADNYVIDTKGAHASINFSIKHLGYSFLTGRFNVFSGSFSYDPKDIAAGTVNVVIDTASVDSNHAERDKHLRDADFLNVEKYPKATFVSRKIVAEDNGKFAIIGDLTLNGVTKSVTIAAEKVGEGKDPWGGYRIGFSGTTEFALKDFNIKRDLGPASQTVKLELHVEGVLQ